MGTYWDWKGCYTTFDTFWHEKNFWGLACLFLRNVWCFWHNYTKNIRAIALYDISSEIKVWIFGIFFKKQFFWIYFSFFFFLFFFLLFLKNFCLLPTIICFSWSQSIYSLFLDFTPKTKKLFLIIFCHLRRGGTFRT